MSDRKSNKKKNVLEEQHKINKDFVIKYGYPWMSHRFDVILKKSNKTAKQHYLKIDNY